MFSTKISPKSTSFWIRTRHRRDDPTPNWGKLLVRRERYATEVRGMNSPQNLKPDATTGADVTLAAAKPPIPPAGMPVTASPPKWNTAALLAMWSLLGALLSAGGAVVGAIVGVLSSSPCTGMLCGLDDLFYGGVIGWLVGILGAINAAVLGHGSGSDKAVRVFFVVVGVVALPMALVLPLLLP